MHTPAVRIAVAILLAALGIALASLGVYIGHTDDAPGAAAIGFVLMIALIVAGVRVVRRRT